MSEEKTIFRLSAVSFIGNTLLSAFKLYAGITGHSSAMLSDAVHSLSDVLSTAVAAVGARLARRAPDRDHPYGHDRFECVASIVLGVLLIFTGAGIGQQAVKKILAGNYQALAVPSAIALAAAAVSIAVKEGMYWYTRSFAKKIKSSAFMADAWHHRSDALSSIGSLIGIGGAMLGVPVLEPVACVCICLCILKVAYDVIRDALAGMTDSYAGEDLEKAVGELIRAQEGVLRLDMLHTRRFGSRFYIDAEIAVDGSQSLYDAHRIAEEIHNTVERRYPQVKHIMIHENPLPQDGDPPCRAHRT